MIRARVDRTRNDTFHIAYIKMKNNDPTTSEVSTLTFSSHKVPELAKAWSDFINRKIFGNEDGGNYYSYSNLFVLSCSNNFL